MRVGTADFEALNASESKDPRITIEIASDTANTDLYYFTSHADCEVPSGTASDHVFYSTVSTENLSGSSQGLDPINARASIGNLTFSLVDADSDITTWIKERLDALEGLRRKRVIIRLGYQGLSWTDYLIPANGTQLISSVSFTKEGRYNFRCEDIQRSTVEDIFDPKKTTLFTSLSYTDVDIPVDSSADFATHWHGTSYTDSPSRNLFYVIIDEEIIRCTGKSTGHLTVDNYTTTLATSVTVGATTMVLTSGTNFASVGIGEITDGVNTSSIRWTGKSTNTLTGVTGLSNAYASGTGTTVTYSAGRGVLNTKAVAHETDTTVDSARRKEVKEFIYIEMPAPKLLYAILTGTLHNDASSFPAHWNLGISIDYVATSYFTNIDPSLWNPSDDTTTVPVRFLGLEKTKAKTFIEKELLLFMGCFMPVLSDGQLALKKMSRILSGSPFVEVLSASTNIVTWGELIHDMEDTHNRFRIEWNWDYLDKKFTRQDILDDANSRTIHQDAPELLMQFKGMHGATHTTMTSALKREGVRDRYAGPPLRLDVTCMPSMNKLEVGDTVLVELENVRDYNTGLSTGLSRVFEIQKASVNWVTGEVNLSLFGSSKAPDFVTISTTTTVLDAAAYTTGHSTLTGALTSAGIAYTTPGGTLTITGSGTLAGNADLSVGGNYYYLGDLTINAGVTLTISDNVGLWIQGDIQNNGTIYGKGGGLAGATGGGGAAGTVGATGYTKAGGGIRNTNGSIYPPQNGDSWGGDYYPTNSDVDGLGGDGAPTTLGVIELTNNTTSIDNIPTDLRGTSGGAGKDIIDINGGNLSAVSAAGGAGGAGGAGLLVVCQNMYAGVNSSIDLSGADGVYGDSVSAPGGFVTFRAGSGAGGAPGNLLILIDGDGQVTDVPNQLTALLGNSPVYGDTITAGGFTSGGAVVPRDTKIYSSTITSYFTGFQTRDWSENSFTQISIPDDATPIEDVSVETSIPAALTVAQVAATLAGINTINLEINATPPSDGNYRGTRIYVSVSGQEGWNDLGEARSTAEVVFNNAKPNTTYAVRGYPVSVQGVQSEDYLEKLFTTDNIITTVINTGNKILTSATTGTTAGVEVSQANGVVGYNSSGVAKFSLNPTTGLLTCSDANVSGTITATTGAIGGWTIGATTLSGGNATLSSTGYLNLGTGNDIARIDAADATYRLWIGNATAASAPFRVTKAGVLTASGAVVSGTITATTGAIGGWTVAATTLTGGGLVLDSANTRARFTSGSNWVEIGATGLRAWDNTFGNYTVQIPVDGSAPTFSSGTIKEMSYEIYTSGVIKTSSTVGDGSASSYGVKIDSTGVKGFPASSSTPNFHLDTTDGKIKAIEAEITGGGITLSAGGSLKSTGKTVGSGTGIFLGYDTSAYKLDVGDHTNEKYLYFDGTDLLIGRDTQLHGTDAYNNTSTIYLSGLISSYSFGSTSSGTGAVSTPIADVVLSTPATSDKIACYISSALPLSTRTWDKSRRIKIQVKAPSSTSNSKFNVGMGFVFVAGTANCVSVLFSTDGNMYGLTRNGSSETSVLLQTYSASAEYKIELILTAGANAKFYINDVLKATTTTNLPSGGTYANYYFSAEMEATSGGGDIASIGEFKFLQEP